MHPAPSPATELPEPMGGLSVENLTLVPARASEPVLAGVSFAVEPGVSVAVIGPSGSGKSSLARALAGIWPPARGAIRLDDAALPQWDPAYLGRHIGYLPQEVEFFAGTVAENIARLGAPEDRAVIAAAKSASVHEAVLRLPQGYETPIGEGETPLSGGMRPAPGPCARPLRGPAPARPRRAQLEPRHGRRGRARRSDRPHEGPAPHCGRDHA